MLFMKKRAVAVFAVALLLIGSSATADGGTFVDPIPSRRNLGINAAGLGGNSYTEHVGGGTWDHGTTFILPASKQAYSNYYHVTLEHRSSCRVGKKYGHSSWTSAGDTSYSQVTGGVKETSQAWWSTDP